MRCAATLLATLLLVMAGTADAVQLGLKRYAAPLPAPGLEAVDVDGSAHRLSDFAGEVLVVNFWATWCLPCRLELPAMERAADALAKDGVTIITVAMGAAAADVRALLPSFDFALLKLVDPSSEIAHAWRVQMLPTSYVVDRTGQIVLRVVGNYDWEDPSLLETLRDIAASR